MRAQSILPFHENKFDALKHSRLGNWRGTNSHWKNSNPISGCCSYVCWCGKYGRPGRCTRFSSLPWWVVYFLPCWQYPPMLQLLYYSYFKIMSLNNAVFGILHKGAVAMNKVCGCYSVSVSCSPSSIDQNQVLIFVLHKQIYDETSTKIVLNICPPLIYLWLLEVDVCRFLKWIHRSPNCGDYWI